MHRMANNSAHNEERYHPTSSCLKRVQGNMNICANRDTSHIRPDTTALVQTNRRFNHIDTCNKHCSEKRNDGSQNS